MVYIKGLFVFLISLTLIYFILKKTSDYNKISHRHLLDDLETKSLTSSFSPSSSSLSSIIPIKNEILKLDKKYFHEHKKPYKQTSHYKSLDMDTNGYHYDKRFFKKFLNHQESRTVLVELLNNWTRFINSNGIDSWLAHGTLLGWYWGEGIFPWDDDVDLQLLCSDLNKLDRLKGNMPFILIGNYILRINPHFKLKQILKQNTIDARFIDTLNGKFIDITCLYETLQQGYLSCKKPHFYDYNDIFPLLNSTFENIPVKIPIHFRTVLNREYGRQSLIETTYKTPLNIVYRFKPLYSYNYFTSTKKIHSASSLNLKGRWDKLSWYNII